MRKKKNGFLTFIFSWIPGCAEMYWGYMKCGVSLLALFMFTIFLAGIFGSGVFVLFGIVAYAYAFFHARNMAHMSDEEFAETEDAWLISEDLLKQLGINGHRYQKLIAGILIVCGGWFLLDSGLEFMGDIFPALRQLSWVLKGFIPKVLASVILIGGGVLMIRGRKKQDEN